MFFHKTLPDFSAKLIEFPQIRLCTVAKGGVGCILINNVNCYVLHRLDRACAERLAGLADIEFHHIFGQV